MTIAFGGLRLVLFDSARKDHAPRRLVASSSMPGLTPCIPRSAASNMSSLETVAIRLAVLSRFGAPGTHSLSGTWRLHLPLWRLYRVATGRIEEVKYVMLSCHLGPCYMAMTSSSRLACFLVSDSLQHACTARRLLERNQDSVGKPGQAPAPSY
jgi:hypothetical protein